MIVNKFSATIATKLLKITKISEDTGISRTTLTSLYYRRTTQFSLDVLDELCKYLNCSICDIIEYVPDCPADDLKD